jgi:hypothetical protein
LAFGRNLTIPLTALPLSPNLFLGVAATVTAALTEVASEKYLTYGGQFPPHAWVRARVGLDARDFSVPTEAFGKADDLRFGESTLEYLV